MTRAATFDPAPLLRQIELSAHVEANDRRDGLFGRCRVPDRQIAELLGVPLRQVQRWRGGQRFYQRTAERLAERAGFLPCEIWPSWYDVQLAELGKACEECGTLFVPRRRDGKFCSTRCKNRAANLRYIRSEKGAARRREYRLRYYAECGEYVKARARERYRAKKDAA